MVRSKYFEFFKINLFSIVLALLLPVTISLVIDENNKFYAFLNFGYYFFGENNIGYLAEVLVFYVLITLILFLIENGYNNVKKKIERRKKIENLWIDSIKFNLFGLITLFSIWLIFILNNNYYDLKDKLFFLFFLVSGPLLSILFCYLSCANIKLGSIKLEYFHRFFAVIGIIILFFIIPRNVGLAGPLVLFMYCIPVLYSYIGAEIFNLKSKPRKKSH